MSVRRLELGDGRAHVHEPAIALDVADDERDVPHPQAWVTSQLRVLAGSAPVLGEEQRQVPA